MLEAIGDFGRNLRGPTPYEMSGKFLQKRKRKVQELLKSHQESWELTGCSVMTDAWTDKRGRGVMNLVVHSAYGVCFLDSVDCSAVKKDGRYIFEPVAKCIEEIGVQNVVQVVTDKQRKSKDAEGSFGKDIAKRQCKNIHFDPGMKNCPLANKCLIYCFLLANNLHCPLFSTFL